MLPRTAAVVLLRTVVVVADVDTRDYTLARLAAAGVVVHIRRLQEGRSCSSLVEHTSVAKPWEAPHPWEPERVGLAVMPARSLLLLAELGAPQRRRLLPLPLRRAAGENKWKSQLVPRPLSWRMASVAADSWR